MSTKYALQPFRAPVDHRCVKCGAGTMSISVRFKAESRWRSRPECLEFFCRLCHAEWYGQTKDAKTRTS